MKNIIIKWDEKEVIVVNEAESRRKIYKGKIIEHDYCNFSNETLVDINGLYDYLNCLNSVNKEVEVIEFIINQEKIFFSEFIDFYRFIKEREINISKHWLVKIIRQNILAWLPNLLSLPRHDHIGWNLKSDDELCISIKEKPSDKEWAECCSKASKFINESVQVLEEIINIVKKEELNIDVGIEDKREWSGARQQYVFNIPFNLSIVNSKQIRWELDRDLKNKKEIALKYTAGELREMIMRNEVKWLGGVINFENLYRRCEIKTKKL